MVGLGGIGQMQSDVFASEADSELVAAVDRNEAKRDAVASRLGCRTYASVDDMLANEQVDLVSVCTAGFEQGGAHLEPTMKALAAGAHVLVEKPVSNDIAEARTMVDEAKRQGLVLATNLNHRFVHPARRLKEWIDAGEIGEPLLVAFNLWVANPVDETPYFQLRELHSHSFDILRHFAGEIVELQAFVTKPTSRSSTWSSCSINLRFASGAVGSLHGSYDMTTSHPFERFEIAGSKGRAVLDNVYERLTLMRHDSEDTTVVQNPILGGIDGFYHSLRFRIRQLLDEIRTGAPISASGDDGLRALELIESAIASIQTGEVVACAPQT
ncbi:Gfo/Idh/MocA family protein [Jiangella alba]|uniref:Gfo/Idh/MocA family protein n=1 Tax=Jiangella alba TaxID=561176 RepID=UPI0015A21CF2|nr:Gfo/Idh/MocA family oxidoreductase [Jiangella alba]